MSDEKRTQITDLLRESGINYSAVLVLKGAIDRPDTRDGKPWEHDAWEVIFTKPGALSLRSPFKTGTGLRQAPKMAKAIFARSPKTAFDRRQLEVQAVPVAPHAADVLYSFIADDTRGASFRDWCGDFGYDEDSRKALATYEQCQRQTDDAVRFFGRELFEKVAEVLQDY